MHPLLIALIVSLGINLVMFVPAFIWKTDKLTDISYAVTFAVIAIFGFVTGLPTLPAVILLAMILLWALRIGSYLLIRIWRTGKDARFDGMREKFWSFLKFWVLQGVSVWVVLLPSIFYFAHPRDVLSPLAIVGILIWALGISIESIADIQKYRFMNNTENKGMWIESGIWKYSRHPNYFGEILVWLGVFLFTLPGLSFGESLIGLFSPLYIAGLIIFVSGIPMLEKSADERWGNLEAYREYKRRTSVLILWFRKK